MMSEPKPIELPPLPENPLVSVLIANYNHARFVGKAIESVQKQTYQRFEVIICDDGSQDDSLEVLARYATQDPRIKVIPKNNGGQASALNAAYAISEGEIIAILDADDEWYPHRLERVLGAFRSSHAGLVTHILKVVDANGKVLKPKHPRHLDQGWVFPRMIQGWQPYLAPASGLSLRREVAEIIFPLPENFRVWADRILGERAALISLVEPVQGVLGLYRQHEGNLTGYLGSTTLEGVKRDIEKVKGVLRDREDFVRRVYPDLKFETKLWERRGVGGLRCYQALLSGDGMTYGEIRQWCSPKQALLWALLFALPTPLAQVIYQYWRSEPPLKRYLAWLIATTRW